MNTLTPPLDIQISPVKPRFLCGEGIAFSVITKAQTDLTLETVHLNRNRTSILLTDTAKGAAASRTLTGKDYMSRHHVSSIGTVGASFALKAGTSCSSTLELLQYSSRLDPGHYQLELDYRFGDDESASVRSNVVEFDVDAVESIFHSFRWFAGSYRRDMLESIWGAAVNGVSHWFYQIASKRDPGVLQISTDLPISNIPVQAVPCLAHLNTSFAARADRFIVWVDAQNANYTRIHRYGLAEAPGQLKHSLAGAPTAVLVDPPLQLRAGGVAMLIVGVNAANQPSAELIVAGVEKPLPPASFPLSGIPRHSVVYWEENEEPLSGFLITAFDRDASGSSRLVKWNLKNGECHELFSTPQEILELSIDQYLGRGRLLVLLKSNTVLSTRSWDLENLEAESVEVSSYDLARRQPPAEGPVGGAVLDQGADLALLLKSREYWIVMAQGESVMYPLLSYTGTEVPRMVATPRQGVFLVYDRAGHIVAPSGRHSAGCCGD